MTPTDIQNKRFDKGMSGYRAEDVHNFLNEVAAQVESLLEERDDLQHKLEILAEKMEQYREDEESLRAALIGAQKLGDSVVRDSKRKAESIIAQATRRAEEIVTEAQTSIDRETMALNQMQMEVAKFKGQILSIYKAHIELIQDIPGNVEETAAAEGEEKKDVAFVAHIGETVQVTEQEAPPEQDKQEKKKTTKAEATGELPVEPDDGEEEEAQPDDGQIKFRLVGDELETGDAQVPERQSSGKYKDLSRFFGEDRPVKRKD